MKKSIASSIICALLTIPSIAFAEDVAAKDKEEEETAGWFRLDSDALGLQLWAGAVHSVGPVDIASNIYVNSENFGELDIGPAFSFGSVSLLPMAGIGFDWSDQRAVTIIAPQLFSIIDTRYLYFESWVQFFFNSVFEESALGPGDDIFYTRNFLLYKMTEQVSVGPQAELTAVLNDGDNGNVVSFPVGGRINLGYGENNILGLFLGYETEKQARKREVESSVHDHGLVGRFSFIRFW